MKSHFLTFFQYEAWANEQILQAIERYAIHDQQILKLFSHILSAQALWLQRLNQQSTLTNAWQVLRLEECKLQMHENQDELLHFLQNTENFQQPVTYQNLKGETFTNSIYEILTHLFNHSSYHRGQIVLCLKNYTQDLPVTDMIFYLRKNGKQT